MFRKTLFLAVLCGLAFAASVCGDGEKESVEVQVQSELEEEGEKDLEEKLHDFFDDSQNKIRMALYNLSEYLPLSVEYAEGVGMDCDVLGNNRHYYSNAGLATSAIMILLGVIFAFFGYRLIKCVLFLIGFVLGSSLTYFVILAFIHDMDGDWVPYTAGGGAVLIGIICGVLTICIYYIGIFLSGASIGFLLTWFVLAAINVEYFQSHIWIPFVAALVGALVVGVVTLCIQKWFFILGTAVLGAFKIIWGIDYFLELGSMMYYLFLFAENRANLKPCWYSWGVLPTLVVLIIVSFLVQAIVTGRKYDHKEHLNGVCCGACATRSGKRGGKVYMEMKDPAADV